LALALTPPPDEAGDYGYKEYGDDQTDSYKDACDGGFVLEESGSGSYVKSNAVNAMKPRTKVCWNWAPRSHLSWATR
jgi:hypothetical protein